MLASGLYTPWPYAIVFDFGASNLHFRYGRQSAIPLAPHSLLPPCMQSSVLACWLDFGQAGLASLPTSAFVAHIQPFLQLNRDYLFKNVTISYHIEYVPFPVHLFTNLPCNEVDKLV
jgi:hypothetical protein